MTSSYLFCFCEMYTAASLRETTPSVKPSCSTLRQLAELEEASFELANLSSVLADDSECGSNRLPASSDSYNTHACICRYMLASVQKEPSTCKLPARQVYAGLHHTGWMQCERTLLHMCTTALQRGPYNAGRVYEHCQDHE